MRVPAVSVVSKIMIVAVVGLLACALMPLGSAFAEGKEAPSALLASSLMDGSASVVREDVTLAAPEGDAVPEPVIGSFTVDGLTFAVLDESHVELVGVAPSVTLSEAAEGGVVEEPNESRASEAGATNLALPESVTYEGVSYALASIAPYAFYLSGVADVTLPASVSDVDDRAFRSSDMANVMVAEGNPTYSSFDGALYDASQSSLLLIPEGKQGAVRIPKTAEVAEASVFSHCPLVDSISVDAGSAAFASENGLLYTSDLTTLLRVPAGATDITIREGCTTIAAAAMEVCVSLERINAPASVTSISPYLFEQEPETVVAPVAFAAKDEDGGSTESGPSQISSVVALHDVLDLSGFPDPSTIDLALNERSDVALWKKVGFILEDGHSDDGNGGMASMLPALSQKTALPNYDSVEGLPPIVDGVQSAATYASYSTMSHMLQSGITGAAVFVITSCVTESGNLKPGDCFDDKIGQGYTPETYWMNLSGASFELERGDGCRVYGYVEAKPGYTFKGWASSPFGTPSQSFSRTDYASGGSGAFTYTHYAIFETNTYTITLNTYGASPYNDNSWTEVIANSLYTKTYNIESEKITLPFVLRSGYYFAGWIGANGTTPAMSVTVDKGSFGDKSYTASYEKIHTVTYSSAHGTPERPHDSIYQSNSTVTLPDIPSVDLGFEFNGWESPVWTGYKKAGDVVTFTDTENVTVTASFTKTEYAITLDTQGGSVSDSSWKAVTANSKYTKSYTKDSDKIELPTPSRQGYYFKGWSGPGLSFPQMTVVIDTGSTEDRTYTANWGDPGTITIHLAEDLASKKIFKYMKPSTQGIQGDGTGAPFGTSMPGRSLFPVGRDQYGITLANTMYLALEGQHFNSWPVADFCNKGYLYDVAYCCINGGNLFEPSVGWSYTAAGDESIDVYVTQGTACKVTWDANGGTLEDDGGAEVSTRTDWRGKGKGISAPF
ncbi:MAG: leucine-rich repeat protein, partial [Eggerthellaceae bacterium]|nr:leucine-rich repeat protein [Eggerthellaceae bacterium]